MNTSFRETNSKSPYLRDSHIRIIWQVIRVKRFEFEESRNVVRKWNQNAEKYQIMWSFNHFQRILDSIKSINCDRQCCKHWSNTSNMQESVAENRYQTKSIRHHIFQITLKINLVKDLNRIKAIWTYQNGIRIGRRL